jgi:cytochrome P450
MEHFTPPYPPPLKKKASLLQRFWRIRHCWISAQYERSYHMKMGHVHVPLHDTYIVNEPALVHRVLVDEYDKFPKHRMLGVMLKHLLGESIFTTNGAVWQRQRRMMDPAFEQAGLKNAFARMHASVAAMLARLDALGARGECDVEVEMTYVTADIIFRTILSQPIETDEAMRIFRAFRKYQEASVKVFAWSLYRLPGWLFPAYFVMRNSGREIRATLAAIIQRRKVANEHANKVAHELAHERAPETPAQDILGALLRARDAQTGTAFEFSELVDQVAMLFLAGHETSASALSWALYLLAMSPAAQQRVYDEVRGAYGDAPIDDALIKTLRYTRNVFREALRLYPPVYSFVREATHTQCMRDKNVAAGSTVMVAPWLIHRHRALWHAPDAFDPDRFETEAGKTSVGCAYLPFNIGPRVCIGVGFATQEAILVLASVVRRYRLNVAPGFAPKPVGRLTIRSENGIRLVLERRDAS